MVTAELALAIPTLVFVLAVVLGAVSVAVDRVRCVDAARLAARSLARGDGTGQAVDLASQAAPPGARVSPSVGATRVEVTVVVRRVLPQTDWGVDVSATAVADRELGGEGGPGGG